jgi:hypothetical protein
MVLTTRKVLGMSRQGQGKTTMDKQRCIASAFSVNMKIMNGFVEKNPWAKKYTFFHFDANAGSGWNDEANVPGSPLVFHAMADEHMPSIKRMAFFCDKNETALNQLQCRLSANPSHVERSYILPGDNEDALVAFGKYIIQRENPMHALGCLMMDPNGYWYRNKQGDGPPTKIAQEFVTVFPKIDVVLNMNVRSMRTMRSWSWGANVPMPHDVLTLLNKKYWLIRRTHYGSDEFLLAVGRNAATGDHSAIGLHHLDSEMGQKIMAKIEGRTKDDLDDEESL